MMGWLDRLLGRPEKDAYHNPVGGGRSADAGATMSDEQAVERYRYLLRTAPPEDIERAHEEAFAQLTPQQRAQVLEGLSNEVPPSERDGAKDDPKSLARLATRAELRQPGTMERTFGRMGAPGGVGLGGIIAGSLFASIAGSFIGTAIAQEMLGDGFDGGDNVGDVDGGGDYGATEIGTSGFGESGFGAGDFGGGDFGGGGDGGGGGD